VIGVLSGTNVQAEVRLEVRRAPLARVLLDPAVGSVGVGGLQVYRARGLDAAGNDLGDVTEQTVLSISHGGSCAGRACTADRPGVYTVTGRVPGAPIVSAVLRVTQATLAELMLEPTVGSIVPGASQAYQARGLDVDGNDLGDMTARTTFTMAPKGSCSAATCMVAEPGDYAVTGTARGTTVSTTVPLRVVSLAGKRPVADVLDARLPWVAILAGAFLLFSGGAVALRPVLVPTTPGPWIRGTEPSPDPRRDGPDWVRSNVRAESRSSPARAAVRDDPSEPGFRVRLEPYADNSGRQTVEESPQWR
jgi:hypothetical protein